MNSYSFLAGCYDALTADVPYEGWADYIERHFRRAGLPVRTVLDLACGTGSLTRALALRGYEMIGVDQSADMLTEAAEKCRGLPGVPPILLNQSMEKLDLYGAVDACVCCLDSVNYVTSPKALARAFARVHLFLMPGGLFLFDIRAPAFLRELDGQVMLDETENIYCVWRAEYQVRRKLCCYGMDIFQREGALWRRGEEYHEQRVYEPEELCALLRAAGFQDIRQYGDKKLCAPAEGEERIFFAARKERNP